jgi:hypothetical protein
MKIYNALALPAVLYGCETWAVIEQDKCRVTSAEMKLMRRIKKYTRQDYRTSEGILSKLKTNPVVKKIKNYRNKWIQHVRRMDSDRQTATLNCEISTVWETKPRTTLQKTSRQLVGQVRRSKTVQAR